LLLSLSRHLLGCCLITLKDTWGRECPILIGDACLRLMMLNITPAMSEHFLSAHQQEDLQCLISMLDGGVLA
jgi:hypothetical protein